MPFLAHVSRNTCFSNEFSTGSAAIEENFAMVSTYVKLRAVQPIRPGATFSRNDFEPIIQLPKPDDIRL